MDLPQQEMFVRKRLRFCGFDIIRLSLKFFELNKISTGLSWNVDVSSVQNKFYCSLGCVTTLSGTSRT